MMYICISSSSSNGWAFRMHVTRMRRESEKYEMKNPSAQIQFPHRQKENSGKVNKFNWQPWKVDLWLMRKGSRKRMFQSIIKLMRNERVVLTSVYVWFCGMNRGREIGLCDPKKFNRIRREGNKNASDTHTLIHIYLSVHAPATDS